MFHLSWKNLQACIKSSPNNIACSFLKTIPMPEKHIIIINLRAIETMRLHNAEFEHRLQL